MSGQLLALGAAKQPVQRERLHQKRSTAAPAHRAVFTQDIDLASVSAAHVVLRVELIHLAFSGEHGAALEIGERRM